MMKESGQNAANEGLVHPVTADDAHVVWVSMQVEGGIKSMPVSVGMARRIVAEVYAARRHRTGTVRLWVQGVIARARAARSET
jgi:hypothetical protein